MDEIYNNTIDEIANIINKYCKSNNSGVTQEELNKVKNEMEKTKAVKYVTETIRMPSISKSDKENPEKKESIAETRNLIKKHIMNYGSLYCGLAMSSYRNYNGLNVMNHQGNLENSHAVSLIGWDDNFSKENFPADIRPNSDGAYLFLNSWGSSYSHVWISYEDRFVESNLEGTITVEEIKGNIDCEAMTIKDIETNEIINNNRKIEQGKNIEISLDVNVKELIENNNQLDIRIKKDGEDVTSNAKFEKKEINNNKANAIIKIETVDWETDTYIIEISYGDEVISKEIRIVSGMFDYKINSDKTITILKYNGQDKNVEIPTEYLGYKVIGIADNALNQNHIESIRVHKEVVEIGKNIIKTGVIIYVDNVVDEDGNNIITKVEEYANTNGFIAIREGISVINGELWSYNTIEKKLIITGEIQNNSVSKVPWRGLRKNIYNVEIKENIKNIGNYAFYQCSNLKTVSMPENVTTIGVYAFYQCTSLEEINIPNNVTRINDYSFAYCSKLKNIIIPNSVTSIGESAFMRCEKLNKVYLSKGVKHIQTVAFSYCENLKCIVYGGDSITIDKDAFKNREANETIKTLIKKKDAEVINNDNSNLAVENISIKADCVENEYVDFTLQYDDIYEYCIKYVTEGKEKEAVNKRIYFESLGDNEEIKINIYMYNELIESIDIPIIDLKKLDFDYEICNEKATITRYFGNEKEFTIPEKYMGNIISSISAEFWSNTNNLEILNIPKSIDNIQIGEDEYNNNKLKEIRVSDDNLIFSSDEKGVLYNKDKSELIKYPAGNKSIEYIIGSNVKTIKNYSFANNHYIESIRISDGVQKVEKAFFNCKNLINIYFPNSITYIEENLVADDGVIFVGFKDTMPEKYTQSNNNMFLNINDTNNMINRDTWDLDLKNGVLNIKIKGTMSNYTTSFMPEWYSCNRAIKTVNISEKTKSIGNLAFASCEKIVSINIPDTVTKIGDSAFKECGSLKNVILPENLSSLGRLAFIGCTNLEEIIIPKNVKSISSTFWNCSSLKKIIMHNEVNSISKIFNDSVSDDLLIYCESGSYAESWAKENNINIEYLSKYKIKYISDIEANSMPSDGTKVEYYSTNISTKKPISKEGIFKGWSPIKNSNEVEYNPNDKYVKNEDVVLYAVWDTTKYSITFNTDGGTQIDSIFQLEGDKVVFKEIPKKKGYAFIGWEPELPDIMPKQNITVVAKWEKNNLKELILQSPPNKTIYEEGEKFDKTGMTVVAKYENGSLEEVNDYILLDAEKLKKNQTTIQISYTELEITKTIEQQITVKEKNIENDVQDNETTNVDNNLTNIDNDTVNTYNKPVIETENSSLNFKPRNNYLSDLSIGIEGKELDFVKFNRYYQTEVDKEVDKISLKYETEDRLAKVEVIGSENLKYGKNIITVVVEAQNGWEREYIIEINRQDNEIQELEDIKYEEVTEQIKENNNEEIKTNNKQMKVILLIIIIGIFSMILVFSVRKRRI